ncbi:hypothetical protein BDR07DRAFT_1391003 [Suillus spraguei]|nr:hypothetical protein BDR07DRAFT_1391003 [Suillus spraguei]
MQLLILSPSPHRAVGVLIRALPAAARRSCSPLLVSSILAPPFFSLPGLLLISSYQYSALQNLNFHVGGVVPLIMSTLTPLVHHSVQEIYSPTGPYLGVRDEPLTPKSGLVSSTPSLMMVMTMPGISSLATFACPLANSVAFLITTHSSSASTLCSMAPTPLSVLPQPRSLMPPLTKQEFAREHPKEALNQVLFNTSCSRVRGEGAHWRQREKQDSMPRSYNMYIVYKKTAGSKWASVTAPSSRAPQGLPFLLRIHTKDSRVPTLPWPVYSAANSVPPSAYHAKKTIVVEDWRSLRLDIQRDTTHTIKDALSHISTPQSVQVTTVTRPGATLDATQQVHIESLPPILILHLKQFLYGANKGEAGCVCARAVGWE